MVCGMPVFSCDLNHEREVKQFVDGGDDVAAVCHGKGSILFAIISIRFLIFDGRKRDVPVGRSLLADLL